MACSYLHSHLGGTHTSVGKRSTGNINRLVETDKFLNRGGEKLNVGGFQACLGEWIGKRKGGENWGLAVNTFDDYIEILPSVHFPSNPRSLLDQPKQANPETDWLVLPGCACLTRDRLSSAPEDSGSLVMSVSHTLGWSSQRRQGHQALSSLLRRRGVNMLA